MERILTGSRSSRLGRKRLINQITNLRIEAEPHLHAGEPDYIFVDQLARRAADRGAMPTDHWFRRLHEVLEALVQKPFAQSMLNRSILEQGELIVCEKQTEEQEASFKEICRFSGDELRAIVCVD